MENSSEDMQNLWDPALDKFRGKPHVFQIKLNCININKFSFQFPSKQNSE